ncbi:MAG: family 16 glycosylhydrolase [Gemmatimonadaceae bacterium]|nr:family 16 glycosylhydrolase [Gemmatimonadaceae bacterium]
MIMCTLLGFFGSSTTRAQSTDSPNVSIAGFSTSGGTLHPGDSAVSRVTLRNHGNSSARVWVGYSVADPDGQWFDVPSHPVTLGPRQESLETKIWIVPTNPLPEPGAYRVVMAVWSSRPEDGEGRRLASTERRGAFTVAWKGSLANEPPGLWHAAGHRVGRGRMRADHVVASRNGFILRLPATSCDGAEVRTRERYLYGEFAARMKTPDAPGSLSALFLYESAGDESDEIDIEIYNDGSRRALLTAWTGGKTTRSASIVLGFDPAAGYHDYVIRWSKKDLVFLADGVSLARWTRDYPRRPMRVIANVWWPKWLPCVESPATRELSIEWVRLSPGQAP